MENNTSTSLTPVPIGKSTEELQDYRLLQLEKELGKRFDEVMDGLNDLKKDTRYIEKRFEKEYTQLDMRIKHLEEIEEKRQEAELKKKKSKEETKTYITHVIIGSVITQAFSWIAIILTVIYTFL